MEEALDPRAVSLGVKVATMRTTWIALVALLLRRGVLSVDEVEGLREAAEEFVASECVPKAEFGRSCREELARMFAGVLPCPDTKH